MAARGRAESEEMFVIRERDFIRGKQPCHAAIWTYRIRLMVPNHGKPSVYVRTTGYCLREEERDIVRTAVLAVEEELMEELPRNLLLVSDNCLKILAEINNVVTICDPTGVFDNTDFERDMWDFQNVVTVAPRLGYKMFTPHETWAFLKRNSELTWTLEDRRRTVWYVRNADTDEVSTRHTIEPIGFKPSSLVHALQLVNAYNGNPKAARTLCETKAKLDVLLGNTRELMLATGKAFAKKLQLYTATNPRLRSILTEWHEMRKMERRLDSVAMQ